jgi:hypothetical protein
MDTNAEDRAVDASARGERELRRDLRKALRKSRGPLGLSAGLETVAELMNWFFRWRHGIPAFVVIAAVIVLFGDRCGSGADSP